MDSFQPMACRLDALAPWERTRRASLAGRLFLLVGRIDELPNGFQLEIASQHRSDMLELVALEQRCCSFLSFEHSNDGDGLRLKITGREGVKTFLAAEFGPRGDSRKAKVAKVKDVETWGRVLTPAPRKEPR